jgi:hypothetical protein
MFRFIRSYFFVSVLLVSSGFASTPTLIKITQPMYYLGDARDARIEYIETPKILLNSSAECWIGLYSSPTFVEGSKEDLNLISVYGIRVELVAQDADGRVTSIRIDASKAVKPERYPFKVKDVTDATLKALRLQFPDEKTTKILIAEKEAMEKLPKQ